jgi:hypothetical protein
VWWARAEWGANDAQYKGFLKDCPSGQLNKDGESKTVNEQTRRWHGSESAANAERTREAEGSVAGVAAL